MNKQAFLVIFLLMISAVHLNAQQKQKFSIASFELDQFDMTAKNEQYKKIDGNGSLYAIIKVTSTNPDDDLKAYNFNFGNMIHEVVDRDGELWVYVQRNAKMVSISRTGYTTLNKYDLKTTIQEGRTYTMQLSVTAAPVYTQMVQFIVEPVSSKAVVMVKSAKKDAVEELFGNTDNDGGVAKSLPYGSYTYRVVAENYHTSEGRFTLGDKTKTHNEKVKLRPNFSEITLHVDAAADIYVNGEKKGNRTWKGILKAGTYQVECRQINHKSSSQYITVEENNNRTIDLISPTPITGTLAITSQPLGAVIRVDGKDFGVTPRNISDMIIGKHVVALSKLGYKSETKSVEVKENQTSSVDMKLSNVTKMTISSNPAGATLYINGKEMGVTPYTDELATGEYELQLSKAKYQEFKKNVILDSSHPTVSYKLKRRYDSTSGGYVQAGFQIGTLMGVGTSIGGYLSDFNFEGSFILGINKSEDIENLVYNGTDIPAINYKPMVFAGKIGFRLLPYITPQIGFEYIFLKSAGDVELNSHVVTGTLGARLSFTVFDRVAIFAVPQISAPIQKPGVYTILEGTSSKIKGWSSGFKGYVGVCVYL